MAGTVRLSLQERPQGHLPHDPRAGDPVQPPRHSHPALSRLHKPDDIQDPHQRSLRQGQAGDRTQRARHPSEGQSADHPADRASGGRREVLSSGGTPEEGDEVSGVPAEDRWAPGEDRSGGPRLPNVHTSAPPDRPDLQLPVRGEEGVGGMGPPAGLHRQTLLQLPDTVVSTLRHLLQAVQEHV